MRRLRTQRRRALLICSCFSSRVRYPQIELRYKYTTSKKMDNITWFRPLHVNHMHGLHVMNLAAILPHGRPSARFAKTANGRFWRFVVLLQREVTPSWRVPVNVRENA